MINLLENLKLKSGITLDFALEKFNEALTEFIDYDVDSGELVYIVVSNKAAEKLFNELFEGASFQQYKDFFEIDEIWGNIGCEITTLFSFMDEILTDDIFYDAKNKKFYKDY
jgi:hypothetical protein